VLLPDVVAGGENVVAERILESFLQPFEIEGHRLRMSPSIGFAVFPDDGDSAESLLKCADVAMYRAKDQGRNTWASYATGMAERAYDRLTLETDLYRALQNHEMRVGYQPIASIDSGRIVGSEALVRWAHPSFGLLMPDEFLSIAEDLGLIAEIDGWVLRQACLELGTGGSAGTIAPYVAVNLSARTLSHPALERMVSDALGAGGLDPKRLVIEIREEVTADDAHVITDALHALRARGVRVALDDFGRGHSALSKLEQLPIDQLKVDPTFLSSIINDPDAPAPVAQAIVDMGHGLGLEVVAEGIETDVQRAFVKRLGFDFAQGWFLGRPKAAIDYAGARSRTA
jgi:predicted signal transduction protein with EAL and GGDEF domain